MAVVADQGLAATALILPLARDYPYAAGAALKSKKKKKERNTQEVLCLFSPPLEQHYPREILQGPNNT